MLKKHSGDSYIASLGGLTNIRRSLGGSDPCCYHCGVRLLAGDELVYRKSRFKKKQYHLKCWKSLFIDC